MNWPLTVRLRVLACAGRLGTGGGDDGWTGGGEWNEALLQDCGQRANRLRLRVGGSKLGSMGTVGEIEEAIRRLSAAELGAFRAWFAEFDAAAWDCQIEEDVAVGRLDALADEAVNDLREGRCTDR